MKEKLSDIFCGLVGKYMWLEVGEEVGPAVSNKTTKMKFTKYSNKQIRQRLTIRNSFLFKKITEVNVKTGHR